MYPSISEYIESIRFAEDNFDRLKHLAPVLKPNGEPFFSQGNFAVVFKMTDGNGKFYALKCFTRELPGRDERYALICDELHYLQSGYFIEMKYFCNELFVSSDISDEELFPVLLMDWVEGVPLDLYLRNCIERGATDALAQLSYRFGRFASWLIAQSFAHGDLKPDNLLVRPDGSLVAVDYDGMFVPAMAERGVSSSEMGSPDYRHPKRTSALFGPAMDHFPLAVMALSLEAIATEPGLLERYARQDGLLFCEQDYRDLSACDVLKTLLALLQKKPELQTLFSLFLLVHKEQKLRMAMADCLRLPSPKTAKPLFGNLSVGVKSSRSGILMTPDVAVVEPWAEKHCHKTHIASIKEVGQKTGASLQKYINEKGIPCFKIGTIEGYISKNLMDGGGNFDVELVKTSHISLFEWTTDNGEEESCIVLHR